MNWPNLVTSFRLLLIPPFILLFLNRLHSWALLVFLVASLSDVLDGYLARRLGQTSPLGAFLDPLADKLLIVSAFTLSSLHSLTPWYLTLLIVLRDLGIVGGAIFLHLARAGSGIVPHAAGKTATFFLSAAMVTVLLGQVREGDWGSAILIPLAAAATVVSGTIYALAGWRLILRRSVL